VSFSPHSTVNRTTRASGGLRVAIMPPSTMAAMAAMPNRIHGSVERTPLFFWTLS
jgi:hypothetical protein